MAGTFKFELVSPERIVVSADVTEVQLPGADGDMTVYVGHAPVVSTLLPGSVRAVMSSGIKRVFVNGGLAEISPTAVTILAERAYITDEADPRQIESDLAEAEAALKAAESDDARHHIGRAIDELKALIEQRRN
ncbi:MAG TPA: ATP synthase F1 subunit epsilon [Hyphomicrobiaceae bacterium]|nr:ATP synthase F1 subunit epsilon [Hyphomicrobiaceae bacterium]